MKKKKNQSIEYKPNLGVILSWFVYVFFYALLVIGGLFALMLLGVFALIGDPVNSIYMILLIMAFSSLHFVNWLIHRYMCERYNTDVYEQMNRAEWVQKQRENSKYRKWKENAENLI